jgi:hypothetical protein
MSVTSVSGLRWTTAGPDTDEPSGGCVTIGAMSVAAKALSTVGAGLVALAVFVPYAEFEGESSRILDLDAFDVTYGFALEPLAVAAAALSPLVLVRVSAPILGMLLAAVGAQTALMFFGYLTTSLNGSGDTRAGAIIGIVGALLILTAGIIGLRAGEPESGAVRTVEEALPPAGWYPDPTGAASERHWNGRRWTEDAR